MRIRYAAASLAGADPAPVGAPWSAPGPTKPNQDAWLTAEGGGGDALLLAVFDGHGVHGGRVSSLLAGRLAPLAAAAGLGRADAGASAGGVAKPPPPTAWPPVAGRRPGDGSPLPASAPPPPLACADATALDAALARAHSAVVAAADIDATLSGSTAVTVAISPRGLALAHVGDSRALLGEVFEGAGGVADADDSSDAVQPLTSRASGSSAGHSSGATDGGGGVGDGAESAAPCGAALAVTPLTADHTPLRLDEAARVLASRGRIGAYSHNGVPVGPLRVWLSTIDAPGLCMTRAIGDTAAAGAGVVARAETGHAPITPSTRYIVLVSDGVTEFASDGDIMAAVHAVASAGGGPADAAAALVACARRQWIAEEAGASDDCTAIVAFVEPAS